MVEKMIIVNDRRVYERLRKQARLNRRFTAFAMLSTACIFMLTKIVVIQGKKIRELDPNANTEETRGIHINI